LAIWGNEIRWNETKHVELEQFWHAFTSRGFDSVSWAFLLKSRRIISRSVALDWTQCVLYRCRNMLCSWVTVDYFSILYYIRLRRNMSITASIVYSKLDYCNCLHYSLPKSEIHHRTDSEIFFTSIHTVVKAPKSSNITPILRSLHWP